VQVAAVFGADLEVGLERLFAQADEVFGASSKAEF
jgi:hypothetical protein